jgi:hypothetical protein
MDLVANICASVSWLVNSFVEWIWEGLLAKPF